MKFTDFGIDKEIIDVANSLSFDFSEIDSIAESNQLKILKAFHDNKISEAHLQGTNGYGYNDIGRDAVDRVFAQVFGAEDALVRYNFINGTHAISTAITAVLRPNDVLLSFGKPYDTLNEVMHSLSEFNINYVELSLEDDLLSSIKSHNPKAVFIQKSKGYQDRKSFSSSELNELCDKIKKEYPSVCIIIDNCYGELTELEEPNHADLIAGSLIKNLGGGIAQTGGYIVGKSDLINKCADRLCSVGIGKEAGATFNANREILQGLFNAPLVVNQAVKGAIFCAKLFEQFGYKTNPAGNKKRFDLIQSVKLSNPNEVVSFCQGVQTAGAIDSFVNLAPWTMPGYDCEVVMASGSFVAGSSMELSADAPIKPPYIVYFQGGLSFTQCKLGAMLALNNIIHPRQ